MTEKTVTIRILDNPKKYNELVHILAKYESINISTSAHVRSIYKELFCSFGDSRYIRQLKNFINTHLEEITAHVQ